MVNCCQSPPKSGWEKECWPFVYRVLVVSLQEITSSLNVWEWQFCTCPRPPPKKKKIHRTVPQVSGWLASLSRVKICRSPLWVNIGVLVENLEKTRWFRRVMIFQTILFTHLFFKMGVNLGSKSLMGGVILVIPITLTILFKAPRIDPNTSGYSSPRYSYNTIPRWPISFSWSGK